MSCTHETIDCPKHDGAYDCTPFCNVCAGSQGYCPTCDPISNACKNCGNANWVRVTAEPDGTMHCDLCEAIETHEAEQHDYMFAEFVEPGTAFEGYDVCLNCDLVRLEGSDKWEVK